MGKNSKKSKSPKSKGSNVSEGKSAKSKKIKGVEKKEDVTFTLVNDAQWTCTVVLMVGPPPVVSLLQQLDVLPHVTVIRNNIHDKTTTKTTRGNSGTRASKDTKKSTKTKASNKKDKETNKSNGDDLGESKVNYEEEKSKVIQLCLSIKQMIVNLRNSDIGLDNSRKKSETRKNKRKEKQKIKHKSLERKESLSVKDTANVVVKISHRYVILSGFYNLMIPEVLQTLMVPVKALINVTLDSHLHLPRSQKTSTEGDKRSPNIKTKNKSIDRLEDYNLFLDSVSKSKHDSRYLEVNKDLLFLNYSITEDITDKSDTDLKENVVKILDGIKRSWDKFEIFGQSLVIHEVSNIHETLKLEDAKLYTTMISMVPLECVSMPVIVHCMLEQVNHWMENGDNDELDSVNTGETEDTDTSMSQYDSLNMYHHINLAKVENITPILIYSGDDSKYNTFHLSLPEFDFEEITSKMLSSSPVYKLWDLYPPPIPSALKWNEFQMQKLKAFSAASYEDHKLYLIHFHCCLMNFFLIKLEDVSSEELSDNRTETLSGPSVLQLYNSIELARDEYSNCFVQEIIDNVIHKVPKTSVELKNCNGTDLKTISMESVSGNKLTCLSDDVKESDCVLKETLLQKKLGFRKMKLDKLKSFLFHPDFVSIYKELLYLEREQLVSDVITSYKFIEELDANRMCQSLDSALRAFKNVHFLHFGPTDSILLWFNNVVSNDDMKSSYNISSSLETPLGFRDFYKYKLDGKRNLTDTILKDNVLFNEILNIHDDKEFHCEINVSQPPIAYNLGSLHLGVFESHSDFFSHDSSCVKVKRANYFDKLKSSVTVTIIKNNTSLSYEFDPENSKKQLAFKVNLYDMVELDCSILWKQEIVKVFEEETFQNVSLKSVRWSAECNISITLPSGLFIEVVRSDTIVGPFYIRQRYLSKGPTCSNIWEENFRCYLKTGTIIIFYNDGSVDILYGNGTKVHCKSFELVELVVELEGTNTMEKGKERDIDHEVIKESSKSVKKGKSKKGKETKQSSEKPSSKKGSKKNSSKTPKPSIRDKHVDAKVDEVKEIITENVLNISEHSVLAWDGESRKYENNTLKASEKLLNLRMAFDAVNQELYLQRSDKMASLFSDSNLTVCFPDRSRITSSINCEKAFMLSDESVVRIEEENGDLSEGSLSENETFAKEGNSLASEYSIDRQDEQEYFVFVELSHLLEHSNYATVNYDAPNNQVDIVLPGNVSVKIDPQGLFSVSGKDSERIYLTNRSLVFQANVLQDLLKDSKTTLNFENIESSSPTIQCKTEDSFGNLFSVDEQGRTNLMRSNWGDDIHNSNTLPRYPNNFERLFVFNRDLSGYELIHWIQHHAMTHNKNVSFVKTPVASGSGEVFSVLTQSPIHRNKSGEYIMRYATDNIVPTLIRRKDLLKMHQIPSPIWFTPEISRVIVSDPREPTNHPNMPEAVQIMKLFKVKGRSTKLFNSFFDTLKKYMAFSETVFNRYESFYPVDTRQDDVYEEGELQRENLFGSKSYYLSDNVAIIKMENESLKV